MPRTSTSFPPGKSGNSKGRPRGAKDVVPKVRALVNAVLEGNEAAIQEAYRRAVLSPKTVLQCLELAAKLNREVGPSALPIGLEHPDRPVTSRSPGARWGSDHARDPARRHQVGPGGRGWDAASWIRPSAQVDTVETA